MYYIKIISKNDLDLLVEKRNILYDEILNMENYDLIKDKTNQINHINNFINFLSELNRFLFNYKLKIKFELVSDNIIFSSYNEVDQIEKSYIVSSKYFDIHNQNNFIDYKEHLQWIKELKISNYIDKLEKYHTNTYNNDKKIIKDNISTQISNLENNSIEILEEISHYKIIFKNYFSPRYNFYLKGGFVIGFKLIQIIYFNYLNKNKITSEFNKKLILDTLDFIRDFDFTLCIGLNEKSNTDSFSTKLDEFLTNDIVDKYFRKEGQVVIVVRDKNNYKLPNGESFLELSIKNCSNLFEPTHMIDLEIPLTAMIIRVDNTNIDMIFDIIYTYWQLIVFGENLINTQIDFDNLINQLIQLDIQIHPSTNLGLFDVNRCDYGYESNVSKLSDEMIGIIEKTSREFNYLNINNKSIEQFLASCQTQPDRLFIRLLNKNIPKSNKCIGLLNAYGYRYEVKNTNITWLLNEKIILEIITKFLINLSSKYIDWTSVNEYHLSNSNTNSLSNTINKYLSSNNIPKLADTLFSGSNLGRLIGEIDKICKDASLSRKIQIYGLVKILFGKNITHELRMSFLPKDTSNIVRVQKSFCDLANSIIIDKINLYTNHA
jgi:hypothetical protein